MPRRLVDLASLAAAVILGAFIGAAGSFLQAATVLGLPVGLLLALTLSVAAVAGSGLATASRAGAALALLAWLAVVFLLSLPRAEGDLVLVAAWHSYVWLYGGALLLTALLVLDYRRLAQPPGAARPVAGTSASRR